MKILVTGHKGYIGTVLVPFLKKAGHEVCGIDSELFAECNFGNVQDQVNGLRKDIRDVSGKDLRGVDCIVHLAGLSNDPLGDLNPELTYEINYRGSVRLAKLAREEGVERFIFASSCSVYGASQGGWVTESSRPNPVTPYAHSKQLAEKEILELGDEEFCPVSLRKATAFGVSPFLRFDLVLNNLVGWAVSTGKVYIKSDGTPWRPLVHIEDISRAYLKVCTADRSKVFKKIFNVGQTEDNYLISDLAEIVRNVVLGTRVEYAPEGGPDKRCYRVDCSFLFETFPELKFCWNAHLGAIELQQAYQSVGLKLNDFEGDRYSRIAYLKKMLESQSLSQGLYWKLSKAA